MEQETAIEYFPVSSGSKAKSVGSAIAREIEKNSTVKLRAIGVQAVNQAVKGLAIASGFLGQKGKTLWFRCGFDDVIVADKPDKKITAMMFIVKAE